MNSSDSDEKLFDALLKVASEEAFRQEIEGMPSCEEMNETYKPSAELDKKICNMIKRQKINTRLKRAMWITTRIAASLGVAIVALTALIFSVQAARNYVLNTLVEWQSDHASFNFGNQIDDAFNFKGYSPTYIPLGFEQTSMNLSDTFCVVSYQNQNGKLITIMMTLAESSDASIDIENTDYSEITVNQDKAYLFKAKAEGEVSIIIWQHDGIVFKVNSTIDYSEIFKVAENITKK